MSFRICFALIFCFAVPANALAQDWPQWRGPAGVNHAPEGSTAPVEWSEQAGLAWQTALPGRGNSSPTLIGDRIYLTAGDADAGTQSLLILDRASGELLKEVVTHEGGLPEDVQGKNSHANSTVASDGERLYAMFLNDEAPVVTAFDLEGEKLWQKRVPGETRIHFEYGFGSSPIVVDGLVIVATEFNAEGSGIYAFDGESGDLAWHTPRPNQFSYSTPALAIVEGRKVLLMCGNYNFAAYDAADGEELWKSEGTTMATCGTMAWDQALMLGFASGGHPDSFTSAVSLTGDNEVLWKQPVKCYEQSVLTVKGYVYAVSDSGVAYCWRTEDGEEMWKQRLRGNFSSSPIYVGNNIYVTSESGDTFVFEANPEQFIQLAKNRLGDQAFATPSPADGRLYHRFIKDDKEFLVAIGSAIASEPAPAEAELDMTALVVTGGHDFDQPEFEEMFQSLDGIQCDFVQTGEMQAMTVADIASNYDAVVMMDMVRDEVDETVKQQFIDLSRTGTGMIFLHFTLASRPYWDEYHEMVGGKFYLPNVEPDTSLHSTYTTDLTIDTRVLNTTHPVTRGMSDFTMTDAFYGNISIDPDVTPLLASGHADTSATIAWTHNFRSSRIVYLMPGFTRQAYENYSYRRFIRNAIAYVGG